jgi:hypothetical protein
LLIWLIPLKWWMILHVWWWNYFLKITINMTISYHQHHSLSHVYPCLTFKRNYSNLLLEIIVEDKSFSISPLEIGLHVNFGWNNTSQWCESGCRYTTLLSGITVSRDMGKQKTLPLVGCLHLLPRHFLLLIGWSH